MARVVLRWLLAAFFIAAGTNHFRMPAQYTAMMPAWLPLPAVMNAVAGACEVLGGIAILVPRFRRAAGWGLIALPVAVFPANPHVALAGRMPGFNFAPATLWLRLPLQAVLTAWVTWVSLVRERDPGR